MPNSVAVLYFDNLSPDTADAYLADGLTEETIAHLGQIERLVIKSRASVQRFRGSRLDPASSRAMMLENRERGASSLQGEREAFLAMGWMTLGEPERALAMLADAPRTPFLAYVLGSPPSDPARRDPRFQRIVEASRPQ